MTDNQANPFGSFRPTSDLPQVPTSAPHQSNVMSPSISSPLNASHNPQAQNHPPSRTPGPSGQQASSSLLNLLKFGSNVGSPQSSPQAVPVSRPGYGSPSASIHGRGISASDMAASFTGAKSTTPAPPVKSRTTSSTSHQDALLRLLNQTTARPESAQPDFSSINMGANQSSEVRADSSAAEKNPSVTNLKGNTAGRRESPIRFFGSNEGTPTPFEPVVSPKADQAQKSGSIFTYVNPFEQLAASSPRNAKPANATNGDKRKIKSPSPAATHASSRRKLTPSGSEVLQSIESAASGEVKNERSSGEALMGIGAPSRDAETVAEALNEVGNQVNRQVESALAEAEEQSEVKDQRLQIKSEEEDQATQMSLKDIESHARDVAAEVKRELDKKENSKLLTESMPTPVVEAVKDVIDEAAVEKNSDEGELTKDGNMNSDDETDQIVHVYQFPLRPFSFINLTQKERPTLKFREDVVMHIARFKKDFDQVDRVLATATNEFIVYGMPKNGGIRVIQQDNGHSSSIFSKSQDRIFNIAISTTQSGSLLKSTQTIIATGVSGTVYWTTIAKPDEEVTQENMEKQGLIIPPVTSQPDSTTGGQLKTRAKKSNRHPEFFAIGRGKSIHIVFTANAQSSDSVTKEGLMDTEKYFAERNLKVTTGKAGKDFTFSEDDSTIASLDKGGKLRIWDVRDLTNEANDTVSLISPIEVKAPILTFSTAHSSEKSWPTSVQFVDKLRPYTKGTALRYIIVGMKQNHTLQLWDLSLGKAVQELSFPHESEADAICSVTYHPASGIIAVGHPTRNSVYFIHLSAPRYNLPAMSQTKFAQRLANKDSTLAKADATAIMSGMREYSFAEKGQIRSIELVPASGEPSRVVDDEEDPVLFELYIMHSKGVTCLGIKRQDLGWSKDSKVLHPIDAEKEGYVVVKELREVSAAALSEASVNGDTQISATPSKAKTLTKEAPKSGRTTTDTSKAVSNVANKAEKAQKIEKKKSKRNGTQDNEVGSQNAATPSTSESYATAAQQDSSPNPQAKPSSVEEVSQSDLQEKISQDALDTDLAQVNEQPTRSVANGDSISLGISGDFSEKELKKIERGVSDEFNKVLGRELQLLYRRFSEDKRVQDAAGAAKQDAMLRLVSSTLSENVEKSLSRIIQHNIRDSVIPSIGDVTSTTLKSSLSSLVTQQIDSKMANILKQVLPDVIGRTLQSPQVLRSVSEQITKTVTGHVEREFTSTLDKNIVPAFTNLAVNVAQTVSGDTERRVREQLQKAEVQHREDVLKIDQLTSLVRGLSETVHTMAAAQSDFQLEILKQQQRASESGRRSARPESPTPSESASMSVSPEQEELDAVTHAMNNGRFEEATVMWLQSHQQVQLFDKLFVRCDPIYLRQTSPLVILSVGAAVTSSLHTNIMERLVWLESVLRFIDARDPEIREVAGRILEVLTQRLEGEFMRIAENEPQSPALRKIPSLARHARELRAQIA